MSVLAHLPNAGRAWFIDHGIPIAVTLVAALIVMGAARLWVRRMQRRMETVTSDTQELNLQRAATVTQAVSYVVKVVVSTLAILLVLGQFHLDLGPLIASAGIAGVALGFGAQAIVRDFLAGFFFLLEDQFAVGDQVILNAAGKELEGRVETLSFRTTELRDQGGTLHVIPNGNIAVVGNRSRPGGPRPARPR